MEDKELKANDIPFGYPLCFNDDCDQKVRCMHYHARLLKSNRRYSGQAVFPTAWQEGECRCFCEKKQVAKAWGFTKLYDNIPPKQRAEARQSVHSYFGSGQGPYYRVYHGENMLTPKQQADILGILAKFDPSEEPKFDHYVIDWNFD